MAVILYCVATYYEKQEISSVCIQKKGEPDNCVENSTPASLADLSLTKHMENFQACVPGFSLV